MENNSVAVALGANVGTRGQMAQSLRTATRLIETEVGPARRSHVYVTRAAERAWGQREFLNACIRFPLPAHLTPVGLMRFLLATECKLGRVRTIVHGERIVDLDLLWWGTRVASLPGPPSTRIPHPRLHRRAFVMAPLLDVFPANLPIPGLRAALGDFRPEPWRVMKLEPL